MRWPSWSPSFQRHRLSVVGLDVGPDACRLVVLSGSSSQPDTVCCAEHLELPEGWVAHGEVLQSEELGRWLRTYLEVHDFQPTLTYLGLDTACVSNHLVTLVAGLSGEDVAFQLQAEVQSVLPDHAPEVCIDYRLDTEPSPVGQLRYLVQAAPRLRVEALRCVAQEAGLNAMVVESRQEAADRTERRLVLATLPQVSAALALQCDVAFGLALRAWHDEGVNFLPYRENSKHLLRRAWLLAMAVCAMGGAFLAAGFAMVTASAAESVQPNTVDVAASARAYDAAHKAHVQAQAQKERQTEQVRWLKARKELQLQTLQWSRVLSQSAQGVWVANVKQQGTRWTLQGEALTSSHAQQLVQQLKTLDIWAQAPELPQLQATPGVSTTGLPVWQFRIEADLKVGV